MIDLSDGVVVEVALPTTPLSVSVAVIQGPPGPQGPSGVGAGVGVEVPVSLSSTWIVAIPGSFTRKPACTVALTSGEIVLTDVTVAGGFVTATFAQPCAGSLILT